MEAGSRDYGADVSVSVLLVSTAKGVLVMARTKKSDRMHKGTGEILAHTAKDEGTCLLEVERVELAGHSILYTLSVFDNKVERYWSA